MAKFAVRLVFGENRDERLAVRPKHREYLASLVERGVLLLSGPYSDDSGALLIYQVADEAELKTVLEADPYTPAKVVAETHVDEWNPLMGTLLA